MLDTAQAEEWYNEKGVGEALKYYTDESKTSLSNIKVVTKIHPRSFSYNKMLPAIEKSMNHLIMNTTNTNTPKQSLDVVLIHSPRCWEGHCTEEEEKVSWTVGTCQT